MSRRFAVLQAFIESPGFKAMSPADQQAVRDEAERELTTSLNRTILQSHSQGTTA